MKRESAARASRRGHPCSCGRVIHGNGYSRHRVKCDGTWITWTAWEAARPRWTHAPGDDPRTCWACVDDVVNAPDEPMGPHDPTPYGTDQDGTFCVCGHHIVPVAT